VFTQVQDYAQATACFERAHEMIQMSHAENHHLQAVVLQNLGAAYNFTCDFQRAIKYHEDAADLYGIVSLHILFCLYDCLSLIMIVVQNDFL